MSESRINNYFKCKLYLLSLQICMPSSQIPCLTFSSKALNYIQIFTNLRQIDNFLLFFTQKMYQTNTKYPKIPEKYQNKIRVESSNQTKTLRLKQKETNYSLQSAKAEHKKEKM